MSKKIYISPSSQTENRYAVGNTTEAVQCRKIATALVSALERCGFEAKTNTADGVSMYDRVSESNSWGADAHIPIHTNAHDGSVSGFRAFCYSTTGAGYNLCKSIMAEVAPITPGDSDSVTAHQYYEVKYSNAPCAYLELGFHDNPTEAQYIIDHTQELAEAICKGVCNYYGEKYAESDSTEEEPKTEPAYTEENFVEDVQRITGAVVDGIPGAETISKTLTLSRFWNSRHALVVPVQKRLKVLGYDVGEIDGIFGTMTAAAVTKFQQDHGCVADGIITQKQKTWRKLLGMA